MRRLTLASLFLWAPLAAWADSLTLKNGQVIEWSAIRDRGDLYEVETPQGTKLTVKKAEIEKITVVPSPSNLTGATFTFDKKRKLETVDLLKGIDTRKPVSGLWQASGGRLVTPAVAHGRIVIACAPPEEYDLTVVVEKQKGSGAFYIGLPIRDKRFMVYLDGTDEVECGVHGVPSTIFREKMFKDAKPHLLTYHVRKQRFILVFDGKKVIDWQGADYNAASLSLPERVEAPDKGLLLGVYETVYSISKLGLVYPNASTDGK